MGLETPVVLLAFANNRDAYLAMLQREGAAIADALSDFQDKRCIDLWREESASLKELMKCFNRFSGRIHIFHYGGHADGGTLRLEADADAQDAHIEGLASLLGEEARQQSLKLVFLNGCATEGQVAAFHGAGVQAVIATTVSIDDEMATAFAEQFYLALSYRATIGTAFARARDYIASRYSKDKAPQEFRGMAWQLRPPRTEPGVTWGLYVRPGGEGVLDWALPESPQQHYIVRNQRAAPVDTAMVNKALQDRLEIALANASPEFSDDLAYFRKKNDDRLIRDLIVKIFPQPIGEQLRTLYALTSVDAERLKQVVQVYETTVKLFCFSVLAQLWDEMLKNPRLVIADRHRAGLNSFHTLGPDLADTFDFFALLRTVVRIFKENSLTPFMKECAELDAELSDEPSTKAHLFMEEMRRVLRVGVGDDEAASFCQQAEEQLCTILADLAFVVVYKPTTIKSIEVQKFRNRAPVFKHMQVYLDQAGNTQLIVEAPYHASMDSGSVIMQLDREQGGDFVNLTPFVIDTNAAIPKAMPNLFFLSYYDLAADAYHYTGVTGPPSELVVSETNLKPIKDMFADFHAAVFAK